MCPVMVNLDKSVFIIYCSIHYPLTKSTQSALIIVSVGQDWEGLCSSVLRISHVVAVDLCWGWL